MKRSNGIGCVGVFCLACNLYALTPAETNLVESIKKGVDVLVEHNPQGWKDEAYGLVHKLEKSAPSEFVKIPQPSATTPMQKGTPPPPPMKKGVTPPPPGPMGGAKKSAGAAVPQKKAEKPQEQIFSTPKLLPLNDEKLLELYTELLADLPKQWNGMIEERVEERTKYGSKVYIVRGIPMPEWTNNIETLKKVLIDKKIKTKDVVEKEIAERIAAVRVEKTVRPVVVEKEQKPSEELSEQDIEVLIKQLFEKPKTTEMSWIVSVKGIIKTLFKVNQALAREYEDKFIELAKEKRFLPK